VRSFGGTVNERASNQASKPASKALGLEAGSSSRLLLKLRVEQFVADSPRKLRVEQFVPDFPEETVGAARFAELRSDFLLGLGAHRGSIPCPEWITACAGGRSLRPV
jgi:hypothetical protein